MNAFDPNEPIDTLEDLNQEEIESLNDWFGFFSNKLSFFSSGIAIGSDTTSTTSTTTEHLLYYFDS